MAEVRTQPTGVFWRPRLPPGLGRAFWLAALLLACAEALLHSEAWMQRYRAVLRWGARWIKCSMSNIPARAC